MSISAWKNTNIVEAFLNGKRNSIPYAVDQIKIMLDLLQHTETPVNEFIDIGAGDGVLSHIVLDHFVDSKAYLVDFSGPMIDAAKIRLQDYSNRVNIINTDMSNSSWRNDIFVKGHTVDAVISGYAIHHLLHGRKYELYREIYESLSEGGLFINIEHVASASSWGGAICDDMFIDSIHTYEIEMGNARSIDIVREDFKNREDKKENKLLSVETQCDWLREIGFQDVDVYFKCYELAVFAGRKKSNRGIGKNGGER